MIDVADRVPLFEIAWNADDVRNAVDAITRGGYWANGPYVTEFESHLESYLGVGHAITVNSGTTALVAALHALGIGPGDEVIVPSFTFIATANAVKLVGGEPVFADIERGTYGLDPSDVEERITDATAAIVPVHIYGTGCKIDELVDIAERYDVTIAEDAAESLGAEWRGEKLGTFGDIAALSFCQNKIVTTGEGGAVVTDDDDLAERVRLYRSHGRASRAYFDDPGSGQYVSLGTNIRLSDLSAAIGCSQLDRIDSLIEGRQRAASRLDEGFADISTLSPHAPTDAGNHVYQLYTVELAESVDRNHVIDTLEARGIASKVYWDPPIHRTEYYAGSLAADPQLPTTEAISRRVLSLPMHPNLSSEETTRIVDAVSEAVS